LVLLLVISGNAGNLISRVEALGVQAHVATMSAGTNNSKNMPSPLNDVDVYFGDNGNVVNGYKEGIVIAKHKITQIELQTFKNRVGVSAEEGNYNQLIDGHGTGLRPPTNDEWMKIAESAYIVDNVTYESLPSHVDLSAKPWFPPIGDQDGEGSCTLLA